MHISLVYATSTIFFCLKFFPVSAWPYYCHLPVTNTVMVILQIALVKAFLVKGLFWQFLFFPKFTMRDFIVISPSTKFFHGATIVLLSTNRIFYQIYHHLRITIKVFLYLINFSWMFTFKSTCIFHDTA